QIADAAIHDVPDDARAARSTGHVDDPARVELRQAVREGPLAHPGLERGVPVLDVDAADVRHRREIEHDPAGADRKPRSEPPVASTADGIHRDAFGARDAQDLLDRGGRSRPDDRADPALERRDVALVRSQLDGIAEYRGGAQV